MLKAILHGKAGRIDHNEGESVSWSSLFKAREDLLTSTIFERFAYLSACLQNYLLNQCFANSHGATPVSFGEFEGITYWPRFTHEHGAGSNQVEPDLIIHFDQCNIIVEVKPPAGGDQYFGQWKKEIESFLQVEENRGKPLYFLAVGRVHVSGVEQWKAQLFEDFSLLNSIGTISWQDIVNQLIELQLQDGERVCIRDKRVIADMLKALGLYGLKISEFKWEDLLNNTLPKLMLTHKTLSKTNRGKPCTSNQQLLVEHAFPNIDLTLIKTWMINKND
ncbi:hypothetical protein MSG37_19965 [Shewanella sp. 1CM18E]|uniref:hypothetical protein n=1 Tax=Shewanella sp. 1CM18E TaxID=2929169 RepID=UPI0020C151EE|nr:hypothetical protein [Shewanella sp. 1CM18E]MCK8047167.1 hypothetical protein [Shewanella sp. 1CM18E]